MKVTQDGFVWRVINKTQAQRIMTLNLFDIYELHDDDSESRLSNINQVYKALDNGSQIGIEVGYINEEDNKAQENGIPLSKNCKGSMELKTGCGTCEACKRELEYKPVTNLKHKL